MHDNEYIVEYCSCPPDGLAGSSHVIEKCATKPHAADYAAKLGNSSQDTIIVKDNSNRIVDTYPRRF